MAGFSLQPPDSIGGILLYLIVLFIVTFFIGSIPWGVLISRIAYGRDIRNEGSGNIGTTNAMRSLGRVGGAAVFILDFAKGIGSGLIGFALAGWIVSGSTDAGLSVWQNVINPFGMENADYFVASLTGDAVYHLCIAITFLGCVWGHIFSPWLKFKGGKGIATSIGCLFILFGPIGAVIELLSFALVVAITRYVSAGSLTASILCPILCLFYFWDEWTAVIIGTIAALTVIWAHRGNIRRLAKGEERRIGDKNRKKNEADDSIDSHED